MSVQFNKKKKILQISRNIFSSLSLKKNNKKILYILHQYKKVTFPKIEILLHCSFFPLYRYTPQSFRQHLYYKRKQNFYHRFEMSRNNAETKLPIVQQQCREFRKGMRLTWNKKNIHYVINIWNKTLCNNIEYIHIWIYKKIYNFHVPVSLCCRSYTICTKRLE